MKKMSLIISSALSMAILRYSTAEPHHFYVALTQGKKFIVCCLNKDALSSLFKPNSSSYTYFSRDNAQLRLSANLYICFHKVEASKYRNTGMPEKSPASLVLPLVR
jgi:hypothetical protein